MPRYSSQIESEEYMADGIWRDLARANSEAHAAQMKLANIVAVGQKLLEQVDGLGHHNEFCKYDETQCTCLVGQFRELIDKYYAEAPFKVGDNVQTSYYRYDANKIFKVTSVVRHYRFTSGWAVKFEGSCEDIDAGYFKKV